MANAGQWGLNIGGGAASGAATGAFAGPWGAAIGGVVGGGLGALQTLLSSSDEAKQRKKAMEEYERKRAEALHRYTEGQRNKYYDEWEQRYAARNGLNQDPMYAATHHKSFDPAQAEADFNAQAGDRPEFPDDPPPNYAALVGSLGSLGSTVGGLARQGDAQARLDELIQSRRMQQTGNPWIGFADQQQNESIEEMLKKARGDAWSRTGGW